MTYFGDRRTQVRIEISNVPVRECVACGQEEIARPQGFEPVTAAGELRCSNWSWAKTQELVLYGELLPQPDGSAAISSWPVCDRCRSRVRTAVERALRSIRGVTA